MIRMLCVFLACCGVQARAQTTDADRLGQAIGLLERASELSGSSPDEARTIASDAVALLTAALSEADLANPEAQRALGNAHLLSGDLGRAVLAYRRAVESDPSDAKARASLAHARSLVAAGTPPNAMTRTESLARAARSYVPRRTLFWGGAAALLLACVLLSIRLHARVPLARSAAASLGALALVAAFVLTIDHRYSRDPDAVVVLAPVTARTGPDETVYPSSLAVPVPAGAEGIVRETRPGWSLIALGSAEGWVPENRLERVHP